MRKGTSGIKTVILLVILAVITIYGLYRLTETDLFNPTHDYIVREAGEASIVDFQKSCKIYTESQLLENSKEIKGKPIYYHGKIADIKESPFGDSNVTIKVFGDKYKLSNGTMVNVKVSDTAYLRANKGDNVEVFGKFESISDKSEHKIINIDCVRIIEVSDD